MEELPIIHSYITIPVDLTDFIIRRKKSINLLRVYLLLNSCSHGHLKLTSAHKKWVAYKLGITYQAVQSNIEKLLGMNWVGLNEAKRIYHIRGIRTVWKIIDNRTRMGVTFLVEKDLYDKQRFRGFIYATSIGNLAKIQRLWGKQNNDEGYHTGCSHSGVLIRLNQKSNKASSIHHPIAANAIRKIFGISKSSASEYRTLAQRYGYLDVKINLKPLSLAEAQFYQADPLLCDRVRRIKGQLFLQGCHMVAPKLEYRRIPYPRKARKKLKHVA